MAAGAVHGGGGGMHGCMARKWSVCGAQSHATCALQHGLGAMGEERRRSGAKQAWTAETQQEVTVPHLPLGTVGSIR